jgi:hypothetical protein
MGTLAVQRLFERMKNAKLEPIFKTFLPILIERRTSEQISLRKAAQQGTKPIHTIVQTTN